MNKNNAIRILVFLVVVYVLYSVGQTLYQNYQIDQQVNSLKNQITTLQKQIDTDKKNITYYQSSQYIQKVARESLNLAAPGEKVMVVEPDQTPKVTPKKPKDTRTDFQKWWDYFFGS